MTDHDMRALALNLAHTSERVPADVLERAQKYYDFLSGRGETKITAAKSAANALNALNPYATSYQSQG